MSRYGSLYTNTPQSAPLTPNQVKNNAGGFVYTISPWDRLDRFLVLGSDSNTYYQKARDLTIENAGVIGECVGLDAERTVQRIVEISVAGRAPKNDPAIFALALIAKNGDKDARQHAFAAVAKVCRTATHLMQFVETSRQLGKGWGRGMVNAVSNWYNSRSDDQLAYQLVKYRQRESYTHERLIRLAHPGRYGSHKASEQRSAMYDWLRGRVPNGALPRVILEHLRCSLLLPEHSEALAKIVAEHKLPWEALPTWANTKAEVWRAQMPFMGMTALIRNLGNMTRHGAITPMSKHEEAIVARLEDVNELKKARVHPMSVLIASKIYARGKGQMGKGEWEPNQAIVRALNKAFRLAFKAVEPTGKRHLLALDVSGSMGGGGFGYGTSVAGVLSPREASSAMALVTLNVEPLTHIVGFTSGGASGSYFSRRESPISPLKIHAEQSIEQVCAYTEKLDFGGTDCALPMLYAKENNIDAEAFVIYTDNETWAGGVHPSVALRQYREKSGLESRLAVVGMTSTGFSIADPNDAGMMDFVGFDTNAPALIADFMRGFGDKALEAPVLQITDESEVVDPVE